MLSEETEKYIRETLNAKGINKETQNYVIKYVYLNQQLFGNFIDINQITENIVSNLEYSISMADIKTTMLLRYGNWDPYKKRISIDLLLKLGSKLSNNFKDRLDSIIMHELDHCATTKYFAINEEQEAKYIKSFIDRNQITNPKKQIKIKNVIHNLFKEHKGIIPVSGIRDFRQLMLNDINLDKLNEGITAYKQELYDKFLGKKTTTSYIIGKDVAAFIADIIGEEKLIIMHSNNDYNGIKEAFREKTDTDLNILVQKLNEMSNIKMMFLGKIYVRKFAKKMHRYMATINKRPPAKRAEESREVVPKSEINHQKIKLNLNRNSDNHNTQREL